MVAAAFVSVWVCSPEAAASSRYQTGGNSAALVVRFSDNSVYTQCISFTEPEFYLDDLLLRASLNVQMDEDSLICSINGTGCSIDDNCRCGWNTDPPTYWSYFKWESGQWRYQYPDIVYIPVAPGDVFGFSWGPGNLYWAVPPPAYTYDQICVSGIPPAATATATATVTATAPVAQATTPGGQAGDALPPPQVTFSVDSSPIAWGACTVLRWVAWDATQVTLNGQAVTGQEWLEVCPEVTERYVLVAANSTGQTTREIVVEVTGTDMQPPSTAVLPLQPGEVVPVATPVQFGAPDASLLPQQPVAPATVAVSTGDGAAGAVFAASPTAPAVPTVHFTFAPTATLTPRPRRMLGAEGRPTPTPLLVARADLPADQAAAPGGQAAARTTTSGPPPLLPVEDRSFSVTLLPGYAAYLILAAALAGACVWVIRRQAGAGPER